MATQSNILPWNTGQRSLTGCSPWGQTRLSKWTLTHHCKLSGYNLANTPALLRIPCLGLPWWHSEWESACQWRGHGFDPWSGRILCATEQLGPYTITAEPEGCNYWGLCAPKPVLHNWGRGGGEQWVAYAHHSWRGPMKSSKSLAQSKINKKWMN